MTREHICSLLREYKRNKGKLAHLRVDIKWLESVTGGDFIKDMAYSAQILTDMPRGNETSDPTAKIAVSVADNGEKLKRHYAVELERMEARKIELLRDCGYVEAWLEGLPEKERDVIQWHEIDGKTWAEVTGLFDEKYGHKYSGDGMKTIKKRAVSYIFEMTC